MYTKGASMKSSLILTLAIMLFQVAAYAQDIDLTEGKIEATEAGNRMELTKTYEGNIDLTEGKIEAVEAGMKQNLVKEIEAKEIKAIQLISVVSKFKIDSDEEYYSFLARYNTLQEDDKKGISSSVHDLRSYSERFDLLIKDLQKFLK
jgi:formyltetrahydrofolate synthetase